MNVISQDAFAKIAVNKSLLKEYSSSQYSRVVYLNDGDEYQIQLFNSEKYIIAAKIYIDGEELNDMLVLRPGERIWLERYLDRARKFKFSTYEIEDSAEAKAAASLNGQIKVEFYRVKTPKKNPIVFINNVHDYYHPTYKNYDNLTSATPYNVGVYSVSTSDGVNTYASSVSNSNITADSVADFSDMTLSCCSCDSNITYTSSATFGSYSEDTRSIETGRTEEGGYSSQKFSYVDYDFENWPFKTETIQILPLSRKPHTSEDLQKRYCTNCGRKISPKHKFCPYCGTKVE